MKGIFRGPHGRMRLMIAGFCGVGALGAGTVAFGHVGPSEEQVIHSCVDMRSGALRIVGSEEGCRRHETPLDWNAQGRAAEPAEVLVDCGAGDTLGAALAETAGAASVDITIRGTCEESVDIDASRARVALRGETAADGIAGSLSIHGVDRVEIADMTIESTEDAVYVQGGAAALAGVTIDAAASGISAVDTELHAVNTTVTASNSGVVVGGGSTGNLENTSIDGAREGVSVYSGSSLSIYGGTITNSMVGVSAEGAASVALAGGAVVTGAGFNGVTAGRGGSVVVHDAVVENSAGTGVFAFQGGSVEVDDGAVVRGNGHGGVGANAGFALVAGAVVTANEGSGVFGYNGGHVTIQNGAVVEANDGEGVQLGVGSSAVVQDATVRDNSGNGISVNDTSVVGVNSATITGNGGLGIACAGAPSVAMISPGSDLSGVSGGENCPGP